MPPFRDFSPVYGMDPETARRLVDEYRRARFAGTEAGLVEARQILERIRSGRYLKPIEPETTPTAPTEEEIESAKREFFVPGGGVTLTQPETHEEEEAEPPLTPRRSLVSEKTAVRPTGPTRYSMPEKTALVEPERKARRVQDTLRQGRTRASTRRLQKQHTETPYPSEAARARVLPRPAPTTRTIGFELVDPVLAFLFNLFAGQRK